MVADDGAGGGEDGRGGVRGERVGEWDVVDGVGFACRSGRVGERGVGGGEEGHWVGWGDGGARLEDEGGEAGGAEDFWREGRRGGGCGGYYFVVGSGAAERVLVV